MAAAVQVPAQIVVGDELTIDGTGFADTHAYTVDITLPGPAQPSIKLKGTTSGAGAITGADVASVFPGNEGIATVTVSDGTDTITKTVEVFRSL